MFNWSGFNSKFGRRGCAPSALLFTFVGFFTIYKLLMRK